MEGRTKSKGRRNGRGVAGFTLIELMLVITLLVIILIMAIPAFLNSRKSSNESSAIASLRSLSSSQTAYRIRFGSFGTLGDLMSSGYVDNTFSDGEKSGYRFASSGLESDTVWAISADPINVGVTGDRGFLVDQSGVIRFHDGGSATPVDSAIQ